MATVYLNDALSFVPCFKYARVTVFVGLRVRVRDSVMNSPFFPYPPPRPCPAIYPPLRYVDSADVILFTSRQIHYLVDKGGQFNENYYGMKHELIECITSEQAPTPDPCPCPCPCPYPCPYPYPNLYPYP